jgi:branched-chain amino acid transport system ATP-binding protein
VMMRAVDRIIVMDGGEKIAEGTPSEVMENRKVIEAYFG